MKLGAEKCLNSYKVRLASTSIAAKSNRYMVKISLAIFLLIATLFCDFAAIAGDLGRSIIQSRIRTNRLEKHDAYN